MLTDVTTGNGGLLPHLFTFTASAKPKPEIYSLWHFLAISVFPKPPPLSRSVVPYVVRTFLSDSYRSDKAACCDGKIKVIIRAIPQGVGLSAASPDKQQRLSASIPIAGLQLAHFHLGSAFAILGIASIVKPHVIHSLQHGMYLLFKPTLSYSMY